MRSRFFPHATYSSAILALLGLLVLLPAGIAAQNPPELSSSEVAIARITAERQMAPELRERELLFIEATQILDKSERGEMLRQVMVTHYSYEDDMAILTRIDPRTQDVISTERVRHLPVPLAEQEFARAVELAFDHEPVREALGDRIGEVEPEVLLLHSTSDEDPFFGRRVVRMMFRIEHVYFDYPIALVDLTRGEVELESREGQRGELPTREQPVFDPTDSSLRLPTAETTTPVFERPGRLPSIDPILPEELEPALPGRQIGDFILRRSCCPKHTAAAERRLVEQSFPPSGTAETAWRVTYGHATGKGLYITGAWFRTSANANWMRVLWDARLSDIFVPYHTGSPRYLDLTGFNFDLVPVSRADLGCCGQKADDFVVKEVRDRGILWKDDTQARRGHELVLWSTLDAANYNYIIAYHFRDDGSIGFRMGATAQNLPGRRMEAHMHNGLWRVDVDLGGAARDTALLTRHQEAGLSATDSATPFNGGEEGNAVWNAEEFTGLRIRDESLKNGLGESVAYDLLSARPGNARHAESYMKHEFWVTRYDGSEIFFTQLPSYVSDQEPVTDTDIVLWYVSPAHHLPRREDGNTTQGYWDGVALVMWTGFDLRPRNLFDGTPLHP